VKRPNVLGFLTRPAFLVGMVMLVGLLLRLRGVTWGLPYLYDPDEHYIVDPAFGLVIRGDLNPRSFFYPGSTIMYLLGLAYLVYWMVGHFAGWFPDLQSFAALFWANPTSFYLIARLLAIVLATLAVPLTYAVCRRMAGQGAALGAAIFVAVSPLHVEFSRVVRTDPTMATCLLAALLCGVKAMDSQRDRDFFFCGMFIGLAAATKYPGIIGAPIVLLATVLARPSQPVHFTIRGRWVGLAMLGGAFGFLAAAPFVVTALRQVYWILVVEGGHSHLSAAGGRGLPNYLWYMKGPLREAVGWPLELAALVGLVVSFRARSRPRLLVASFSLLFLLAIGLSLKRWDRWVVVLMPCVAILAAIGLEAIVRVLAWWGNRPRAEDIAVIALGVVLVLPSATEAVRRGSTTLDSRDVAKTWIEDHIPRGSNVAVEQYTPPISRDAYHVYFVGQDGLEKDATTRGFKGVLGDIKTVEPLRRKAIDYVLLSDFSDRFKAEKQSYRDEARFYEELFGSSDVLYEFKPTERIKGPTIRVLKLRR